MAGNREEQKMPQPPGAASAESMAAVPEEREPVQQMPGPDGVKPPPPPLTRGIEVVANRAGFYDRFRKVEGDRFMIPSMKQLGDWMDLADPKAEKQRRLDEKKKADERKKRGM